MGEQQIRFETKWVMVECTRRGPRHAMKSLFKRSSGYLGTSEGCTPLLTAQTRVEEELLPTAKVIKDEMVLEATTEHRHNPKTV